MKKLIHCVYINDFFPELWGMCLPTIKQYAFKIGAELNIISQRKFPQWHINYEKAQVYEDGKYADANFLLDADILIHPDFPDFSCNVTFPHHIAFNDNYNASSKFKIDDNIYFQRDGRDVGIASNAIISFKSTHDVWKPLKITPQEGRDITMVREGDIDEYMLSYNMARYGLKYTGITWENWQRYYFVHIGTGDRDRAVDLARTTLYNWNK
jgi:hypothetical protein